MKIIPKLRIKKNDNKSSRFVVYEKSKSSPAFSYYSAARDEASKNQPKITIKGNKKTKEILHKTDKFSLILGFAMIALFIFSGFLNGEVKVVFSKSSNSVLLHENAYYDNLATELNGGSVTSKHKFTIDRADLEKRFKESLPEADQASVSIPLFGRSVTIFATVSNPKFYIQDKKGLLYLVSDKGMVISSVKNATVGKIVINDEIDQEIKPGMRILSKNNLSFIDEIIHQLSISKQPGTLTLPSQLNELRLILPDKTYVKFLMDSDARIQYGAFRATAEQLAREGAMPSEYIDVRVGDKTFVR